MKWMFFGATSFNQPLDKWNVFKVVYMEGMFAKATSFNQPLNNWKAMPWTTMRSMFDEATSFNQPRQAPWYWEHGGGRWPG